MDYNVKVTGFNADKIANRLYNNDRVGIAISETAARYMNEFVPFKMGALSSTYTTKPFKITYEQPYAHRMYTHPEYNFNKEQHPNATAYWDRAMVKTKGERFGKEVKRIIEKGGNR